MSEVWAVLPAAGKGERFSKEEDKLGVRLGGIPLLARTVQALLSAQRVHGLIIACPPGKESLYREWLGTSAKQVQFVAGGADRRASVLNGVKALPDACEVVVVHDAARPLIAPALVDKAIAPVVGGAAGCVVAMPMQDTVKEALGAEAGEGPEIARTLDRSRLWRAQTPQVFRKDLLLQAHAAIPAETPVTDDAQLLELAGLGPVILLEGPASNLKVTTPDDRLLAEAWLSLGREPAPHGNRFYGE